MTRKLLHALWFMVLLPGLSASPQAVASAFELLDVRVEPGGYTTAWLDVTESFAGQDVRTPVRIVHGLRPGPVFCLTGGVHGDELNGIEVVNRMIEESDADELAGTLVGVPIVNLPAFQRAMRYLPDRRDLNRHFPGDPNGSLAARVAYRVFDDLIRQCDFLLDLHTASNNRYNTAQVRGDLRDEMVRRAALRFGTIAVHSPGQRGTLRRAAMEFGIPALVFEGGEAQRFSPSIIEVALTGARLIAAELGMIEPIPGPPPQPVFRSSKWVRAPAGGVLLAEVDSGASIAEGQLLGVVYDPILGETNTVLAPRSGVLIGRANDQIVMPGYGTFHIASGEIDRAKLEQNASSVFESK